MNDVRKQKPASNGVGSGELVRLSWRQWLDIKHGLENGEAMWKTHAERYRHDSTYSKPGAPIHPVHRRVIQQYARALKTINRMEPNRGDDRREPRKDKAMSGEKTCENVTAVSVRSGDWFGDLERNWSEDFGSENGAYGHVCRDCGQSFVGHKRRPNQCRKCALVAKAKWDALTPEQQAEEEKAAMAWLKASSPNAAYQPAGGEASTESKSNERKP